MNIHANKTTEIKSNAVGNNVAAQQVAGHEISHPGDNRPETIAQRKIQDAASNSEQVKQFKEIKILANNSPQVKQLRAVQTMTNNKVGTSGTIQLMPEEDRPRFQEMKIIYQTILRAFTVNAGEPAQVRRICYTEAEQIWKDIYDQYQADSFPQEQRDALHVRSTALQVKAPLEIAAALRVQAALTTFIGLDSMVNAPDDEYLARQRYNNLIAGFNADIGNGNVVAHEVAMLADLAWLTTNTVDRTQNIDIEEAGGEDIDARQWQQYQEDVREAIGDDDDAVSIYDAFEALNPGWLGGRGIARLQEQFDTAITNLEKRNGWVVAMNAAIQVVKNAFAAQSTTERQAAREAELDAADEATADATAAAAAAALNHAVQQARPQLPATYISTAWSQWGNPGFQIPKSFYLRSNSGVITVYFQSNMDATAKHLREYLDNIVGAVAGPQALAYLEAMRARFNMLTNAQINQDAKIRSGDWEFLFKANEQGIANHRTCYHIVPKAGPYHT